MNVRGRRGHSTIRLRSGLRLIPLSKDWISWSRFQGRNSKSSTMNC
ncbi:hypothetical protein LINPERPRIM_LOCUS23778 [Linum perenne]